MSHNKWKLISWIPQQKRNWRESIKKKKARSFLTKRRTLAIDTESKLIVTDQCTNVWGNRERERDEALPWKLGPEDSLPYLGFYSRSSGQIRVFSSLEKYLWGIRSNPLVLNSISSPRMSYISLRSQLLSSGSLIVDLGCLIWRDHRPILQRIASYHLSETSGALGIPILLVGVGMTMQRSNPSVGEKLLPAHPSSYTSAWRSPRPFTASLCKPTAPMVFEALLHRWGERERGEMELKP